MTKQSAIQETKADIQRLKDKITQTKQRIERRKALIQKRLKATYINGGTINYLSVILGAQNFSDFLDRIIAVRMIMKQDHRILQAQRKDKHELQEAKTAVDQKLATIQKQMNHLKNMKASLRYEKQQRSQMLASLKQDIHKISASIQSNQQAMKQLKQKISQQIAKIQKKQKIQNNNQQSATEEKETHTSTSSENTDNNEKQSSQSSTSTNNKDHTSSDSKKQQTSQQTTNESSAQHNNQGKNNNHGEESNNHNVENRHHNNPSQPSTTSDARTFTVTATAYTGECPGCTGYTATGFNLLAHPNAKIIAVDPSVIPLGSKVYVEGYGRAVAKDIGGAIDGKTIDVFFSSLDRALQWGRRQVSITVYE